MRALVTGGAGFIGSHLVDRLVADGASVRVIDDLSTGSSDNVHAAAELVVGDVCDADLVQHCMTGTDTVFHLAARKSVARSVEQPLDTDRVNTGGTLNVLVAAHATGVRRVVSSSSSSVYGGAEQRPTPESALLAPRSPYAVSKMAAEHYCRVFHELHGIATVSLRYFNVYGPRQLPGGPYAAVIPAFIDALLAGVAPVVHGDGLQSRDFTYVDDVVAANIAAVTADPRRCGGRSYNVAGGKEITLLQLLHVVEQATGRAVPPVHTASRAGDVLHSCAGLDAARADLGWEPRVTMEDGIRRTVAWFSDRLGTGPIDDTPSPGSINDAGR